MIATILTFAISLVLLASLLGYKIWLIRKGAMLAETHYDLHSFIPEHINVENAKNAMVKYGKHYGHETVTASIRAWFRTLFFIKKQKEFIVPKIKALIPKKHAQMKRPAVVSEFLQNVSAYKTRLKKISDTIKEEEKKNF